MAELVGDRRVRREEDAAPAAKRERSTATRPNTSGFAEAALVPRVTTTGGSPAARNSRTSSSS